eukprot:400199-Pyramimonas_sp.AAC.1
MVGQVDEEAAERERQKRVESARRKDEARLARLAAEAERLAAIEEAKVAKIEAAARCPPLVIVTNAKY